MKLVSILTSQSARLISFGWPVRGIYIVDAVKSLQERYGFLKVPESLEEFDPINGIAFEHGKFENNKLTQINDSGDIEQIDQIVIDKFLFFGNGIQAEGRTTVENLDVFLDDFTDWGVGEFRANIQDVVPIEKILFSQLEIQFEKNLNFQFELGNVVGRRIEETFKNYDYGDISFDFSSFTIEFEKLQEQRLNPSSFKLERRVGYPKSSNVFLTSAPLTTSDHLKILNYIESTL